MTSYIDSVAVGHFESDSRRSLLKACFDSLGGSGWNRIIDALCSECGPLHNAALDLLKSRLSSKTDRSSFCDVILACEPAAGLLHALAVLSRNLWCVSGSSPEFEHWIHRSLDHADSDVCCGAASLIVRQFPELIPVLIESVQRSDDQSVARQLCFEAHPDTIDLLLSFYQADTESDAELPTALGLALTPYALVEIHEISPALALNLARQYGYLDATVDDFPLGHLQAGTDFINQAMREIDPRQVRSRVNQLMWSLLGQTDLELIPASGETQSRTNLPDVDSELDRGLLLAAVRELDRSNLESRRSQSSKAFVDPLAGAARFFHARADYLNRELIGQAQELAEELKIPATHRGEFLLQRTAVLLESDDDRRIEAELHLRARWKLFGTQPTGNMNWLRPKRSDTGELVFPEAARLIVQAPVTSSPLNSNQVSPCSRGVDRVLRATVPCGDGCGSLAEERAMAPFLTPLGIEVQIPFVDDNRHIAWKELLIECGIPSPRRRECGRLLEAALPPAGSYHAPSEFLRWLSTSGMLAKPQDLGIHVSLQGDLGSSARYLAFPQLFLNRPLNSAPRQRSGLRLVMSKGLVAINEDVAQCDWAKAATCRTEFRVFSCWSALSRWNIVHGRSCDQGHRRDAIGRFGILDRRTGHAGHCQTVCRDAIHVCVAAPGTV